MGYSATDVDTSVTESLSTDSGAESGTGGSSSMSELSGIVRIGDVDTSVSEPLSTDSGAESGTGGSVSMSPLSGIVPLGQHDADTTVGMGVVAQSRPLSAEGGSLGGTATIERDGEVISSNTISGPFAIVSAPPPSGVSDGPNRTNTLQNDYRFEPDIAALDLFQEDIGISYDGGTVQYGKIKGSVTDYEDNPVAGASVFGEGVGTLTNDNGGYEISAPGGTDVDVTSLDGTTTVTRNPNGGETINIDFQFSRIILTVVDPQLNPMVGTPVEVGNENYETDDNGRVVIEKAGLTPYNVIIDGEEEYTVEPKNQGVLVERQYGESFSGYRVTLKETDTQLPIQSTTVTFSEQSIASQTNNNGRASTLTRIEGQRKVVLGQGDRRYETKTVTVDVKNGEIKSEKATLSRRSNAPTIS